MYWIGNAPQRSQGNDLDPVATYFPSNTHLLVDESLMLVIEMLSFNIE